MSELIEMLKTQGQMIQELSKQVNQLQIMVMKNKVDDTWISESIAAEMIGFKDARTLRKMVKKGSIAIPVRNTNGRNWQYNRKGLLEFKNATSTAI